MSDHFEKPKDWGVAPQSNWVSGTPIGQSEVKMPNLGDPGSHENASTKMSFGDSDGPEATMNWRVAPGGKRIPPGTPCPEGTETKGGACAPSQSGTIMSQRSLRKQYEKDEEGGKRTGSDTSLKRELPKVATEADPQIRRISKEGYKGR